MADETGSPTHTEYHVRRTDGDGQGELGLVRAETVGDAAVQAQDWANGLGWSSWELFVVGESSPVARSQVGGGHVLLAGEA